MRASVHRDRARGRKRLDRRRTSARAAASGRRARAGGPVRKEFPMLAFITIVLLAFAPASIPPQQEQGFTPVQGATLQAKHEAAAAQAASARQTRYWTAYSFDVRPGVAVDVDYVSDDGRFTIRGTWDAGDSGSHFIDGVSATNYPGLETRSLGVFALRDSTGRVERIDVFNLARRHEYSGYP
ncbi:MAG TPA: hypothetical protein VFZ44_05705, partial [Pyrinomonadaceae bacterium]